MAIDDNDDPSASTGVIAGLTSGQLDLNHRSGLEDEYAGPLEEHDDMIQEIGEDTADERSTAIDDMIARSSIGLTQDECSLLTSTVYEYRDIFRVRLGREPPARVAPMRVQLKPGAKPTRARPRQYSPEKRQFLMQFFDNLVNYGMMIPDPNAPWQTAPHPVAKPGPKNTALPVTCAL